RLLQWVSELPPLLGLGIGRHPCHIGGEVVSDILEIGKKLRSSAENRIIVYIARLDRRQHLGPHRSVAALVGPHLIWLEGDPPDDVPYSEACFGEAFSPNGSAGIRKCGNAFRLHRDAIAWSARRHVSTMMDDHGIDKMLVKVVDIFDDATF